MVSRFTSIIKLVIKLDVFGKVRFLIKTIFWQIEDCFFSKNLRDIPKLYGFFGAKHAHNLDFMTYLGRINFQTSYFDTNRKADNIIRCG